MPAERVVASLIPDRGDAATGEDFFRSASFLAAEGATHSLVIEEADTRIAVPLVVRRVPGHARCDAVSPYGYPGGTRRGPLIDRRDVDFSSTGLVSIFLRERALEPTLAGGSPRSTIHLFDPARPRSMSSTFARHVRRNLRAGYSVHVRPGAEVDDDGLASFHSCYIATMSRRQAAGRYFFSGSYLRTCLDHPGSWLVSVHAGDSSMASALIAVRSDQVLHYYLGGTSDEHLDASPAKNAFARSMELAEELAVPLNLGGGLTPGDGLERLKASFTNRTDSFTTHEIVADVESYEALTRAREHEHPSNFFPAYRA
ncbi:GNAT family N-acetyltransferase [Actinomycetospora sp. C-140]